MGDDAYTLSLDIAANARSLSTTLTAATRDLNKFAENAEKAARTSSSSTERIARNSSKAIQKSSTDASKAVTDAAKKSSESVKKSADETERSVSRSNATLRIAQGLAVGVGYKLTSGFIEAGKETLNFEKNMRNVTSLLTSNGLTAGQLEQQYRGLSNGVLQIATTLPQSINQLSTGLYEVVSSGIPAANALNVLRASATAASAGLTDTATSTNAITGVMNAYGSSAGTASQISDVLFQTVNAGVISFGQLAQNVGDVIGVASAAKVPIQDVGAAIAAMTRAGIVPAEATTSLNRLIIELIQPSEQLTRVYKSLGIQSGATELQTKGLYGVMEELRGATGGTATSVLGLFDDIRASRGAFALMSNEGQTYAETQNAIADANQRNGATERALSEQRKSLIFQLQELRNEAQVFAVGLERDLGPALATIVHGLGDVTKFANDNRTVIEALAVVYGVRTVASFTFVRSAATGVVESLTAVYGAAVRAGAGFTLMGTEAGAAMIKTEASAAGTAASSSRVLGLLGGPLGIAAAVGVTGISIALQHAQEHADKFSADIAKGYDLKSQDGITEALKKYRSELQKAQKDAEQLKKSTQLNGIGNIEGAIEDYFGKGPKTAQDKVTALKKAIADLETQQTSLNASSVTAAGGIASLDGTADLAAMAIKDFDDKTKALQGTFENWATPTTAFQGALADAQSAIDAANKASTSSSSDTLKQRKTDLKAQQTADLQALRDQKENISNHTKGSTDAINNEIATLKTKQRAQTDDLTAQGKYASASNSTSKSISDTATVGIDAYVKKLREQDDALAKFQKNLVTIAANYGSGVAGQLQALGPEAASLIDEFANTTGKKADDARKEIERNLDLTGAAANVEIGLQLATIKGKKSADELGAGVVASLASHTKELAAVAAKYGIDLTAAADPVLDALGLKKVAKANVVGPFADRSGSVVVPKADGGFDRGAPTMAPAGANILWAEPETGGESYIPHAQSKRSRSVGILSQTADLFGLAIIDPRAGGTTQRFANGGFAGLPKPPVLGTFTAAMQAQKVMDGSYAALSDAINNLSQQSSGGYGGTAGAAPKGQVVDWIHAAEAIAGWPDSYTNGLYQLIMKESGGNPNAINLTDSNAKAGHPSRGLMQTIPNIFAAYAFPGHGNIVNPVDNILAGTAYALKNYGAKMIEAGGRHNSAGNYIGYADGGIRYGVYDNGGGLGPGHTLVYNGTGKTEHVFTGDQFQELITAVREQQRPVTQHISGDSRSVRAIADRSVRKAK